MKLNPPASSSDLEAAREIARRLHQRRRREDRPAGEGPAPAPAAPRPQPLAPPPPRPVRPLAAPPPQPPPPQPPPPPAAPEVASLDDLPSFDAPAPDPEPPEDEAFSVEEPSPAMEEPALGDDEPPFGDTPEIEVEEPSVSPEEMVGSPEPPPFEDLPAPDALAPEPSPFDVEIDEAGDAPESALPPSWDDVTDACLGLAQARGALLADPSGQVFAARGEWPEPGPTAIAAKLVSMMNRTLKDAPTRSISAPLMGLHLTAWRVPLEQGLVTAAFIADQPVRTEARPAIDTEIHRAASA